MELWIHQGNAVKAAELLFELPLTAIQERYAEDGGFLFQQLQEALEKYHAPSYPQTFNTWQFITANLHNLHRLLECAREVAGLLTPEAKARLRQALKAYQEEFNPVRSDELPNNTNNRASKKSLFPFASA